MKFNGRRLEFCLACGGKLPDGSRIDRKYCRAACIERAYYERHPDKKRVPGARRLVPREARTGSIGSSDASARQVQQRDRPHSDLLRPPVTGQARVVTPEPAPRAAGQPTLREGSQAHALASAQKEVELLKQQLHAAVEREGRIQKELTALRTQQQRDAQEQAAALDNARPQNTNALALARRVPGVITEAQQTLNLAPKPQPLATSIASPASTTPQAGNLPRLPRLWENPSTRPGAAPVPKWLNWAPAQLAEMGRLSAKMLSDVPSRMRAAGSRDEAKEMRTYIETDYKPIFLRLTSLLILRIVFTDKSHRQIGQQKELLAKATLEDAVEMLAQEGHPLARVLRRELADRSPHLFRLAWELVTMCDGWVESPQ